MTNLDRYLEAAGAKFDEACAAARLRYIRTMKSHGWTEEEARQLFTVNDMHEEDAREQLLAELRVAFSDV